MAKSVLATGPSVKLIEKTIRLAERIRLPERALWNLYRMLIGLYIFRGWREGLKTLKQKKALPDAQSIGCHSNV
jgi:hypothetical protein